MLKPCIFISYLRVLKKRPRRVLTEDGKHLLNLWFIPHYTELLIMYKALSDRACKTALTFHLRLVSALHDIVQYLCAHSRLGSSQARSFISFFKYFFSILILSRLL